MNKATFMARYCVGDLVSVQIPEHAIHASRDIEEMVGQVVSMEVMAVEHPRFPQIFLARRGYRECLIRYDEVAEAFVDGVHQIQPMALDYSLKTLTGSMLRKQALQLMFQLEGEQDFLPCEGCTVERMFMDNGRVVGVMQIGDSEHGRQVRGLLERKVSLGLSVGMTVHEDAVELMDTVSLFKVPRIKESI